MKDGRKMSWSIRGAKRQYRAYLEKEILLNLFIDSLKILDKKSTE